MNEEKPKTKSGWRWRRRILIGVAALATLIAILVTEEDWRGKHDWENYKHELEAKGEKLDWQAFVPPAVPDDQNFFCAPIFTNTLNNKITLTIYRTDKKDDPMVSPLKGLSSSQIGYMGPNNGQTALTDLRAWQVYYRDYPTNVFPVAPQPQTPAKDVLLALSKYDSAVEALRQASQRPYANVPLDYENRFNSATELLPILANLKRCTQALRLRAIAELADGQNDKAVDDIKLLLYLNNSLRTSPFVISCLVRMAVVAYDLQPIWEGLAEHKWSDKQLIALDGELKKLDFLADYGFVIRGERAFAIAQFENQRRTRKLIFDTGAIDGSKAVYVTNKLTWVPAAYFYQNEFELARAYQQWLLPLVNTNSRIVSPAAVKQVKAVAGKRFKHLSPYTVQTKMLISAFAGCAAKVASIQTSVDLARVAIALERYRLAHGNYPESLDALAPQFIAQVPHDLISGEPLHYRLEANGQFVLYSVGWNEKDDGGQVVLRKSGSVDRDRGDWVWQYPQNE